MARSSIPYALRGALLLGLALAGATPARGHVELDLPNGGEVLEVGSVYTVTWHIVIAHSQLNWDLWYSTTGSGGPWIVIATDLPPGSPSVGSVHTFDWTLPDTPTENARVRVRMDNSGTDYEDVSDADFTIGQPTPNVIVSSDPPDGAIDARQPSETDGSDPSGWEMIDLTFTADPFDVAVDDFIVTQEGGDGPPPTVIEVVVIDRNVLRVVLSDIIEPGAWTVITHNDSKSSVRIGYLPADVSGDRTSAPVDILALIDFLNGVGDPLEIWQTDIDRSGEANPADILTVIDLLNGAGAFEVWNGQTLPE